MKKAHRAIAWIMALTSIGVVMPENGATALPKKEKDCFAICTKRGLAGRSIQSCEYRCKHNNNQL